MGYEYVDVDLLPVEEKDAVKKEIRKWNPDGSYPTIVINDKECVSGFDETEIKEKIGVKAGWAPAGRTPSSLPSRCSSSSSG